MVLDSWHRLFALQGVGRAFVGERAGILGGIPHARQRNFHAPERFVSLYFSINASGLEKRCDLVGSQHLSAFTNAS